MRPPGKNSTFIATTDTDNGFITAGTSFGVNAHLNIAGIAGANKTA